MTAMRKTTNFGKSTGETTTDAVLHHRGVAVFVLVVVDDKEDH
jgi:hypothetical protein